MIRRNLFIIYSLSVFWILSSSSLSALPQGEKGVAGHAEFHSSDPQHMIITTSDKAIINYTKFDIGKGEHVQFVQPSNKSTVLNRITGKEGTKILGRLSGNGRVFLVNPNGIYFGQNAAVNTGSFIASTLNIRDEDFLNENYNFFTEPGKGYGSIINEGSISANPEGFVALFAPSIDNRGSISARAGKVILASAEKVTLDFAGNGLIRFAVDGDLENALIENYGQIESVGGDVEVSMRAAKKAVKMVVNTDGITPANAIEEVNGVIRLVSQSRIAAKNVHVDGGAYGCVETSGIVDVSSQELGGTVQILGNRLSVRDASINASGDYGGGTVLIGGDYQGKGEVRTADETTLDSNTTIYSDAITQGNGGKVIIWADDKTTFDGKIYARGGAEGGDGGFVETSGKVDLFVGEEGYVNTSASQGNFGNWLLDPSSIVISTNGSSTIAQCSAPNCADTPSRNLSVATLQAAATNVSLCAQRTATSSITVNNSIVMPSGVSLTMTAGSANTGTINLNANIATRGQPLVFTGLVVLGSGVTLDTTNAGGAPLGGNISFSNTVNGANALTLGAGTAGNVTFTGAVGGVTPLTNLTITSANNVSANAITAGRITQTAGTGTSTFNGALLTSTASGISLTGTAFQFLNSVTTNSAGSFALTNSGTATFGPGVGFAINGGFSQSGSGPVNLGAAITTSGGGISIASPVSLNGAAVLNSSAANGTINLLSTINGAQAVTLNAGSGNVTLGGTIGALTPLNSLTVTSASNVSLGSIGSGTPGVSGSVSLPATSGIAFNGTNYNLNTQTWNASTIAFNAGALTTFTSNGNALSFSASALNLSSGTNLTINSGGGNITLSPLRAVANNLRTAIFNAGSGTVQVGQIGASNNGEFSSIIFNSGDIKIRGDLFADSITFNPLPAHQIFLGGSVTTNNTTVTFPVPVIRDTMATATVSTGAGSGDIIFSDTVNGDASLIRDLTLAAGSGGITFSGVIGGLTPLSALTISSANNVIAGNITAGSVAQNSGTGTTTFNGLLNTSNLLGVSLTGSAFSLNNTVTTASGGPLIVSNSGLLSMSSAATLNLDGPFLQTGSGGVQTANSILSNSNILFTSPVVLNGTTSLNTAAGAHEIKFLSTIDNAALGGPFDLTLNSGTSNISVLGTIGSIYPLGTITVTQAENLTFPSTTASGFIINGGTGTATFNGNFLLGAGGFNGTGTNLIGNGTFTTTNGGSITVNNSGTATGQTGIVVNSDGNFSVIGTGPFFFSGTTTVKGNVLVTSPTTLIGPTIIDTTSGGGNITFSGTLDGALPLTLNTTGGAIQFNSNVGSLTPLGALSIAGASNVTTQGIQSESFSQTLGSGTTTFNGPVITSGAAGISVMTNTIVRGGAITTTGGGPLTITNAGPFTSTAAGAMTLEGAFTQNGTGPVSLGGSIRTSFADITFFSPITLAAATSMDTGSNSGDINLNQTVQGAFDLTLNAGTHNITIGGNVGTLAIPLTSFTVSTADNVTTQAIFAGSILQSTGTGTTTFNGALNTNSLSGIALTGNNFTFNDTITTTAAGPLQINNIGLAAFGMGATGSIDGPVNVGSGSIQLSSALSSSGEMQFTGPFSVIGTGSLDTSAANQPITFLSTVDGPGNLTLSAGSGNITMEAGAGSLSPLGAFTISNANNVTMQAVTASSLLQSTGAGSTLFNGNVTTSGLSGVSLAGTVFTFLQNVTTAGTGPFSIVNSGLLTTTSGKTFSVDGAFNQSGGGGVSLAGAINTNNQNISFANPITLTNGTSLDTGAGSGDITLNGTVDGAFDLTLRAGTGNITLSSAVGGITRLGAITVANANNIDVQAIVAASITQLAGTGTSFLHGAFDSNTPAGITLIGNNFTSTGTITTTNSGPLTVTNSGLVTGTGASIINLDNFFLQNGTGPVNLGGSITTNNGDITHNGPATILLPITLNSGPGEGNVVFTNTINGSAFPPGSKDMTITAGVGDIIFGSPVGLSTPIGVLTINSAENITVDSIAAASISGTNIVGVAAFNGALSTTAAAGVAMNGSIFNFNNGITTSGTGSVAITNSGLLTIASGTVFNLDGSFIQSGLGGAAFGGTINTTNDPISFASPINLLAASTLDTFSGIGDITLNGSVDGSQTLTLNAGLGDISILGTVGNNTSLTGVTVQSAANVLFNGNTDLVGPFTITSATGTTTFNQDLEATAISITGQAVNFNDAVIASTGPITIDNSGILTVASLSPVSSASGFSQIGSGLVSLGSNVTTSGALSFASPITMTNDIVMSSGGGNLTLSDTVSGVFDLTLIAGSGDVNLNGVIGAPRIGKFQITSAQDITVQAITAASISQINGTGTSTLNGNLDTNTMAGISLEGNNFTSMGTINTTNGGGLVVTNSGLLTGTGASTITLDGAFTQNGTGPVNTGGTITTNNAPISHSSAVSVLLPATFTSNGGNIVFQNTVDGPACLTLSAGTGDVQLDGALGATTALGCLNASGAHIFQNSSVQAVNAVQETGTNGITVGGDIATNGNNILLTGDVVISNPVTLTTSGGAGNITITGTVNGNAAGQSFSLLTGTGNVTLAAAIGGNTPFNNITMSGNDISWANLGSTVLGATGTTTLNAANNINFNGISYSSGTQNYTAGSNFNFAAGAPTAVSSNGVPISFNSGTMQLTAGTNLTVDSMGGDIALSALLGTGRDLTVEADFGNMTFTTIGAFGQNLNNVTLTANTFTPTPSAGTNVFASSLTVNSPSTTTISTNQITGTVTYNAPVVISGNISYTCGGPGTITYNRSVDALTAGVDSLTFDFNPCGGSVVFNGAVGSTAPLASLDINASTNVTMNAPVLLGSFSLTNGTGTAQINSGMTVTDPAGISIATPDISLSGSITTASGGPLDLNNSGNLTIGSGTSFDISGPLQQTGAGAVSIGGSVITHDSTILFNGPITLNSATTFNSNISTGANISFTNTIQGAESLTLSAGGSDISFGNAVGTLILPLGQLTINNAHNVTASSPIYAAGITQNAGSGTTTFNGLINTNTQSGISLSGTAFAIDNNVTTTSGGAMVVTNSGLLNINNSIVSIAGAFTQNGSGTNTLFGTMTTGGALSFAQGVTLSGTTALDTSANSQNITFSSTLTNDLLSPHDLTLNAGSGNIAFLGQVGAIPIGALNITNAGNVLTEDISALSFTQAAGTGTTTITGDIATTDVAGISLNGNNFSINGNVTTASLGPVSIVNSGELSLTSGGSTLIDGSFTESGGGGVSVSGTVATNNQNLSFGSGISLAGDLILSTGAGAGNITFSGSIDGNSSLNLVAGTGDILFSGNVGSTTPLAGLTVTSVKDVNYPVVNANSFQQINSSGTTTITGPVNVTGSAGVSVTGGAITQNGTIITSGSGPVTFTNTGILSLNASTTSAGSFTQSGGGAVTLGASIGAVSSPILFTDPVNLAADVGLDAGPAGGSITFLDTITGNQSLTLAAPGGTITLNADVGTLGTPLNIFTISNVDTVTTQAIYANTINQLRGTGSTIFNDILRAASGIDLSGTAFTFNGPVTTVAGAITLSNSGLAIFNSGAAGSFSGAFSQIGLGGVELSNATTAGGPITFAGPVTILGSASLDTQAASQPITFSSTLDGPGNLTLASGLQDIVFSTNSGYITRLGNLQITNARNVAVQGIKAASIVQSTGSNLSLFNGDLDTNGAGGITLSGTMLTFLENIATTGGGPITLTNSNVLTTTPGKLISSGGVFTQNGSGSFLLGSSITTTNAVAANANINFSGTSPVTLTAPVTIDSSFGGGTITLAAASTVDGAEPVTFAAGSGDINFSGVLGGINRLGPISVFSAHDLSVQAITASSISQLAGTGTSTLFGNLNSNSPEGITLIGNNFISGPGLTLVTTTNGGSFTITNQGIVTGSGPTIFSIDNSFVQNGPGIAFLGGAFNVRNDISFTAPVIFADLTSFDTTLGSGNITFNNLASALAGTENITLNAGAGNILFSQPLGLTTTIGIYPVTSLASLSATANNVSINDIGSPLVPGVTGVTTLTSGNDVIFTGTTYNANTQNYSAGAIYNMSSGALTTFSSNANPITFLANDILLSNSTDLTINTDGLNLNLSNVHAQAGDHRNLILDAGAGSIVLGNLGSESNGEFASASFTASNIALENSYADTFNFNYTGTLTANGDIVSFDTPITFPNAVILVGSDTISTMGTTGAGITFSGTVDASVANLDGLTLNAGAGNIVFAQSVGGSSPLASLVINSAHDVDIEPAATVTVDLIIQFSGTGTTTFDGTVIVPTSNGILLTGNNFALDGVVQTSNNGPLRVTNSGTLTFTGAANLSGGFTQTGSTAPVNISGSITAGQPISFEGPVTLSGSPSFDTSAASQSITFANIVDGPADVVFAAGNGDIVFNSNVGSLSRLGSITINSAHNITAQSVTAASLNLLSSTGLATVNGVLSTNGAAGVNLIGNNFILNGSLIATGGGSVVVTNSGLITGFSISSRIIDGSYTQNGTGPVNFAGSITTLGGPISFSSPLTLLGPSIFDASAANQNITFLSTIDGPGSLSANAGSLGDIIFTSDVGVGTRLGSVTLPAAHNVSFQELAAASFVQNSGSGTTTFAGDLSTNGTLGITFNGNNIVRGANWSTSNLGPISINNSGLFTSTAAGSIFSEGAFSQIGTGPIIISGVVDTDSSNIAFLGPVTLAGNTSFNTGPGLGSMTFHAIEGTTDGAEALTLTAGLGDITFLSTVGSAVRLGKVEVVSAHDVNLKSLRSTSLLQDAGTGTTTLNGNTDINGILGIAINGLAITLNNNISTSGGGSLTLTNAGILTLSPGFIFSIDGQFLQNGSGSVMGGGSILTNNRSIQFQSPITLTGNLLLSAGVLGADVILSSVQGSFDINILAGIGDVFSSQPIGNVTPVQNFTVTSANDINLNGVGGVSSGITQTLDLNATHDINLANTTYSANSQIYSAGNGTNFNAGAPTNVTSFGGPVSFTNGPIHLSSGNDLQVATNNGDFSFTSLIGSTFENIVVHAGSGTAALNTISSPGTINNLFIDAGLITFAGTIVAENVNFTSLTDIFNIGSPVLIQSVNTAFFNALSGDVGSLTSPIFVQSADQIFAGARNSFGGLADFNGTSVDNTVHPIPSNPPCKIIFNDVVVKECSPLPPPVPPIRVPGFAFPFSVPGVNSSYFNLANNFYFLPFFLDDSYFCKPQLLYAVDECEIL